MNKRRRYQAKRRRTIQRLLHVLATAQSNFVEATARKRLRDDYDYYA